MDRLSGNRPQLNRTIQMRPAAVFLVAVALSIVPRTASTQVSVTSPAAGASSSYRNTTISWSSIPGAASYHLEIDDDPNFGSPEVDVTVAGTSYTLSGERLNLNRKKSWAAYVRINGTRWNANTFTPSYFAAGQHPALAVSSQNLVHLAFHDTGSRIHMVGSNNWSGLKRLSLADTFNADAVNLAIDEFDVAHAFWLEERPTENRVPYYTNSSTGWNLVRIPGSFQGCSKGSSFAAGGKMDIFLSCNNPNEITRWTITNGTQFARAALPNSENSDSTSAVRDAVGNIYVASEREGVASERYSSLQTSADVWMPHTFGPGRGPTVAVTPQGELHALRWGQEQTDATGRMPFLYSNSLRGFQTWTALPIRSPNFFSRELLPLIVDAARGRLYAAIHGEDGIHICSAAHTGLAGSTGTSWTCAPIQNEEGGMDPDGALAPDGTVHFAWSSHEKGLGYANSLGSFLATNLTPQVSFGVASSSPSAVIVPATISDADGDDLGGHIRVGHVETTVSLIEPSTTETIIDGSYTLGNADNLILHDPSNRLEFRPIGGLFWITQLRRDPGLSLPRWIEVRLSTSHQVVGAFEIRAWDGTGATISETDFFASVQLTYSGALPDEIDIAAVPAGNTVLAISAWDGTTATLGTESFTKTAGQNRLVLTEP